MPVNTRTEYALRALLEMHASDGTPISAHKICLNQQLPKKYVEHLLAALKNAGIIDSSIGSKGGYSLAHKAEEISLWDVMQAVDDHSMDMACDESRGEYCLGSKCRLKPFFESVSQQQRQLFQSHSLAAIARFEDIKGES